MLPEKNTKLLTRNGMDYFLDEKYEQYWLIKAVNKTTILVNYEVWKIRKSSGAFSNKWKVKFPSNEDFGLYGWSCQTKNQALKKINQLKEERE